MKIKPLALMQKDLMFSIILVDLFLVSGFKS